MKGVLCTHYVRAQCIQCIHPPPLFGHSCNSRSPAPCGSVGNDCNKQRPKLVRPSVSSDTGIPGAFSGCWAWLSLLIALACPLAAMARFDLEELELPSYRGDGEANEGLTPDWMSFHRKRPPLVTRFPTSWTLPLGREASVDGLMELLSEYVGRKFTVMENLCDDASLLRRGIMSLNARANVQAIEAMAQNVADPRG